MSMELALVPLALMMWAVTYPSRALPWLAPGIERLPTWAITYLRLAGPAALAALAASKGVITDTPGQFQTPAMPLAMGLCVLVVWRTKLLLAGVTAAVVFLGVARAVGAA